MNQLEQAIALAVAAHRGQRDKAGQPYILHPLRVMQRCANDKERTVAVLHDVVEDTPLTAADLRKEGFGEDIVVALQCLTKAQGEDYEAFITRVMSNPLARSVKIQDLLDNMDCTRLPAFGARDAERMTRYVRALGRLRGNEAQLAAN